MPPVERRLISDRGKSRSWRLRLLLSFHVRWIVPILLLLPASGMYGQAGDPARLQSLLRSAGSDSQRVDLLNELSEAWRRRNTDSAFAYARQAYDLARKTDYVRGQGDARLNQAYAFLTGGRPTDARTTIAKARVDFEQRNDISGLGKCELAEATVLFAENELFEALRTTLHADSMLATVRDSAERVRLHLLRAHIFVSRLAYAAAVKEVEQAQALVNTDEKAAFVLSRKAGLQALAGFPAQALAGSQAALEIAQRLKSYPLEAELLIHSAVLQVRLGDTATARQQLVRAGRISRKYELRFLQALALRQSALVTILPDSARKLMQAALDSLPDTTSAPIRAAFHLDMARVRMRIPDPDRALAATDSVIKWLDSVPQAALRVETERLRYRIYERSGNTARALAALQQANAYDDSLGTQHSALEAEGRELSERYETLLRERGEATRLAGLRSEMEKEAREREMYFLIGGGAAGAFFLLMLILLLRSRGRRRSAKRLLKKLQNDLEQADEEILVLNQKLSDTREEVYRRGPVRTTPDPEKLEEVVTQRTRELSETVERLRGLNRELDTFMYRASHDLLGPIARLKGLVLVARNAGEDVESLGSYIGLIEAVSVYMDRVLRKLIIVHELHHASRQTGPVSIAKVVEEITPHLSELPGISQPFILLHDELEAKVKLDEHLLGIVLENLLENACVFRADPSNSRPRIEVRLRKAGRDVEIEIRDEGIGIPDEVRSRVFDIFFRGSERSKGNGLGLYLVKMAVELMGGRIEMESKEGVFTKVTVRVPEAI